MAFQAAPQSSALSPVVGAQQIVSIGGSALLLYPTNANNVQSAPNLAVVGGGSSTAGYPIG